MLMKFGIVQSRSRRRERAPGDADAPGRMGCQPQHEINQNHSLQRLQSKATCSNPLVECQTIGLKAPNSD